MTWWRLYAPYLVVGIASATLLLTVAPWHIVIMILSAAGVLTLMFAFSSWATNRFMNRQERKRYAGK